MRIKEVPIDPEVMVAVDRLVFSICEWSTARMRRCSKQSILVDSSQCIERGMRVKMRARRELRGC